MRTHHPKTVQSMLRIAALAAALSCSRGLPAWAGWVEQDGGWRYQDDGGAYIRDAWRQIGQDWYYFGQDGYRMTGWVNSPNARYYLTETGAMATGEWQIGKAIYHFGDDGRLLYPGYGVSRDVPGLDAALFKDSVLQSNRFWDDLLYGLDTLNEIRASHGAAPLALDRNLSIAASYRAAEMFADGYFGHWVDGALRADVVVNAMEDTLHRTSENIYRWVYDAPFWEGYRSIIDRGTDWYTRSQSHFAAMVNPAYTRVGLGAYAAPDGQTYYYNMIFE